MTSRRSPVPPLKDQTMSLLSRTLCAASVACGLAGCGTAPRTELPIAAASTAVASAEALYQAGRQLQAGAQYEAALETYQRALERDPLHADAHNAFAIVCSLLGRDAEALRHFEAAAALEPGRAYLVANRDRARRIAHPPTAPLFAVPVASQVMKPVAAPAAGESDSRASQDDGPVRLVQVAPNVYEMHYSVALAARGVATTVAPAPRATAPMVTAMASTLKLRMANALSTVPTLAQGNKPPALKAPTPA